MTFRRHVTTVKCKLLSVQQRHKKRKESVKNIRMKRDGKQRMDKIDRKETEECAELNKRFRWNGASLTRGIRDFKWNFSTFKKGLKEKLYWNTNRELNAPESTVDLVYVYQFLTSNSTSGRFLIAGNVNHNHNTQPKYGLKVNPRVKC